MVQCLACWRFLTAGDLKQLLSCVDHMKAVITVTAGGGKVKQQVKLELEVDSWGGLISLG